MSVLACCLILLWSITSTGGRCGTGFFATSTLDQEGTTLQTFNITIRLDDDAMQTAGDVGDALGDVIDALEGRFGYSEGPDFAADGSIFDVNGNKVGGWSFGE